MDRSIQSNLGKSPQPDNSPIFVLGCPRSGTTLLRNLLRAHSRITIPNETFFIPFIYASLGEPPDEAAARRLVEILLQVETVRRWDCDFDAEAMAARGTYAGIVDALFQHWARKEGKPRWGDKTPLHVLHLPLLARLFPDAKLIHIVRDGRDAAASWLKAAFGPENWYAAAIRWKRLVETGLRDEAALRPDQIRRVRYEDLLADPEGTLRDLCAFLNEEFEPAMLTPNPVPREVRPIRRHRLPLIWRKRTGHVRETEIVAGNKEKWRSALTREQRAVFESVAGSTLERLGYETEGLAQPLSPLRCRLWMLDSKVRETALRMNSRAFGSWMDMRMGVTAERWRRWIRSSD